MFATALTRRAYLPYGSVLYSVRFGCTRRHSLDCWLLFISGEVCHAYQTVWIAEGVSRDVWSSLVITIRVHNYTRIPGPTPLCSLVIVAYRYIARMDIYEDFAPRKYLVTVFTRFVDATGNWARRREEFFGFFAWFANTVGIYSNTSIRSGNILTRWNFDSRASPTTMIAIMKSLKHHYYRDCSLISIVTELTGKWFNIFSCLGCKIFSINNLLI